MTTAVALPRRVLVAMSGGVDSSVAAALLLEAGHQVTGVTLKLWGGESDTGCCSVSDVDDARRAADALGIEHHVFNFGDEFTRHVVEPYVADHAAGRTPNPCIECNRHVKFDRLLRRAEALGFDALATGHHARVVAAPGTGGAPGGLLRLARGADRAKDQSYVLHMLGQSELARLLLPVGEMTKGEVRSRAAALGLRVATKPDSQDVCFITRSRGRSSFLARRIPLHPGRAVDASGAEVGRVDAVELVTIGQRKGLGVRGGGAVQYAVGVDVPGRTVTVGSAAELLSPQVAIHELRWSGPPVGGALLAQVSAHGPALPATVTGVASAATGAGAADANAAGAQATGLRTTAGPAADVADADVAVADVSATATTAGTSTGGAGAPSVGVGAVITWAEPQRRVAPGQSVVLYVGDHVVGGGTVS